MYIVRISCADSERFVIGGSNTGNVFFFFLVEKSFLVEKRGSKYHYKRAIFGKPAKHH